MPAVSLREILDGMEMSSDAFRSYVDPDSGRVVTISDDDEALLERDELPEDLPAWQQDSMAELKKLDLERLLPLPDRSDIHEWAIMKQFADAVSQPEQREALLDAIHGKGAFRAFRRELERLRLGDAWREHRDLAFRRIAEDWLKAHGLECR